MGELRLHIEHDGLAVAVTDSLRLLKIADVQVVAADMPADMTIGAEVKNLRLGAVLDWVVTRRDDPRARLPDTLALPSGTLVLAGGVFARVDGESVRLTDKERDLLLALYQAPGHRVPKDDLLQLVWGYVQGLETHTLETHIYRLRQKIEVEPASPKIILTDVNAYRLVLA